MSHKVSSKGQVRLTYEESQGLDPLDVTTARIVTSEQKQQTIAAAVVILDKCCERLGWKGSWGKAHDIGYGNHADGFCVQVPNGSSASRATLPIVFCPLTGLQHVDSDWEDRIRPYADKIQQAWSVEKALSTSKKNSQFCEEWEVDEKTGDIITVHHVDDPCTDPESAGEWE